MSTKSESLEKIRALVDWFKDRKLPKQVELNSYSTIIDCNLFVSTQLARMECLDIYNKDLQKSYLRLMELKTFLEKNT